MCQEVFGGVGVLLMSVILFFLRRWETGSVSVHKGAIYIIPRGSADDRTESGGRIEIGFHTCT